jgi:hypothetical protein
MAWTNPKRCRDRRNYYGRKPHVRSHSENKNPFPLGSQSVIARIAELTAQKIGQGSCSNLQNYAIDHEPAFTSSGRIVSDTLTLWRPLTSHPSPLPVHLLAALLIVSNESAQVCAGGRRI